MKTRLFLICTSPYLETVVYYFMIFVLEMFFEESGSVASKITTKPIIRRQLSKFNQVSDREIFYFILFSLFFFLCFFLFLSNSFPPRIPCAVCGKFKSPNNQSNERKVRLSSTASCTDYKEETFLPLCDCRSPWLLVL